MFDVDRVDRRVEMFIFDVYIAIKKIKFIVKDFKSGEELLYSWRDWDSVIREFEIIGEATKHLLKANLLEKDYQIIVDFSNKITHNYFGIDSEIVFFVAKNDINNLLHVTTELIQNIKEPLKTELIDSFIEDNKHIDFIVKNLEKLR